MDSSISIAWIIIGLVATFQMREHAEYLWQEIRNWVLFSLGIVGILYFMLFHQNANNFSWPLNTLETFIVALCLFIRPIFIFRTLRSSNLQLAKAREKRRASDFPDRILHEEDIVDPNKAISRAIFGEPTLRPKLSTLVIIATTITIYLDFWTLILLLPTWLILHNFWVAIGTGLSGAYYFVIWRTAFSYGESGYGGHSGKWVSSFYILGEISLPILIWVTIRAYHIEVYISNLVHSNL